MRENEGKVLEPMWNESGNLQASLSRPGQRSPESALMIETRKANDPQYHLAKTAQHAMMNDLGLLYIDDRMKYGRTVADDLLQQRLRQNFGLRRTTSHRVPVQTEPEVPNTSVQKDSDARTRRSRSA